MQFTHDKNLNFVINFFASISIIALVCFSLIKETRLEKIQGFFDDFDNSSSKETTCTPFGDAEDLGISFNRDWLITHYYDKKDYHVDLKSKCNESYDVLKKSYNSMVDNGIDDAEFQQLELIYEREKKSIEDVKNKIIHDGKTAFWKRKAIRKFNHQKGLGVILKND